MIGLLLAASLLAALWAALAVARETEPGASLPKVIIGGYVLRLVIQSFIRHVPFFSHGGGGDCLVYEELGRLIAAVWSHVGVHYITAQELEVVGATSLPPNLFAAVIFLNGGEVDALSRLGCTSMAAFAAGLTALNLYTLSVQFGAEKRVALLLASIIYFEPAFLFYTSDMYKDGLVVCFTIGALGSALRLAFRFSLLHVVVGVVCVWALWYVRFYLIFVTVAPLLVGAVGIGSKSVARSLLAAIVLASAAIVLASFTDLLQLATDRASETFQKATSSRVINANSQGGSGVVFEDGGSPYGALPAKLAYTLLSPFPWSAGSLGFQVGKLDAFLWYFILYRAVRACKQADRRLVIMMMTFLVPCTVMYAMSMSNVGLIVRQRLVVVAAAVILASLYVPKAAAVTRQVASRAPRGRPSPRAAA